MKFFILVSLWSVYLMAGITEGQITTKIEKTQVLLTPSAGFHFNDKAPASISFDEQKKQLQPKVKTEKEITFEILINSKTATAKFYVCDDAKTVCERHQQTINLKNNEVKNASLVNVKTTEAALKLDGQSTSNKMKLLIFSAPWCPACIRMETETYNQTAVKKQFKNIEVEKINIDLVENEAISDKFGVKAIPTLILLNKSAEELYRWLDYQPANSFANELKEKKKNSQTFEKLKMNVDLGDWKNASAVAQVFYAKMDWQNAANYFSMGNAETDKNYQLASEVNLSTESKDENEKNLKAHKATLEKAITLTTSVVDRLRWQVEFFETKKELKENIAKEDAAKVAKDLEALLRNKNISQEYKLSTYSDTGAFEKIETLDILARLYEATNNKVEKDLVRAQMAAELKLKKANLIEPGKVISLIYYNEQVENFSEAEELLLKLIAKNPATYVYYSRYANFLFKQKRYAVALAQIDKALEFKQGNEPQLSLTKIKILKELKENKLALGLVDKILSDIVPHETKYKRTKTALLKLKEDLNK